MANKEQKNTRVIVTFEITHILAIKHGRRFPQFSPTTILTEDGEKKIEIKNSEAIFVNVMQDKHALGL